MAGGTVSNRRWTKFATGPCTGLESAPGRARISNAATSLGDHVANMTKKVTPYVCLRKALALRSAPMILGSREFIERARIYRKISAAECARSASCRAGLLPLNIPRLACTKIANARLLPKASRKFLSENRSRKRKDNIVIFDASATA